VRRILFVSFLIIACSALSKVTAAQNILPPTFDSWTIAQTASTQPISLDHAVGADAPIIQEYGFEAIERQEYSQGHNTLSVTLLRMEDPTAAYGAFTYLRAGMPDAAVTKFSAESSGRALIVVGNFLLDVTGERLSQDSNDLKDLAATLAAKADKRPYPSIDAHMPTEGIVPGSERYVLGPLALQKLVPGVGNGDWLGLTDGAEAMLARYRKNGRELSLLLAQYPTQRMAAARFQEIAPLLDASRNNSASPMRVAASRRDSDIIAVAFGPNTGGYADALLGQVAFGHYVTWNEPAFKAKDLSWPTYIVGAFVGTGAIMMIAIATGLGFGLIRVLVKIFFPGKVFDRHRSIEILQLGLSGKHVDTKDLY
jgi:hypothetical protein